jgi:DNA repair protein RadC
LRRFGSIGEIRRAATLGCRRSRLVGCARRSPSRIDSPRWREAAVVASPEDAFALLAGDLLGAESEELWGLYLDVRHRPIAKIALTRGTRTQTIVDPAAVFRKALQVGAHAVIVAHNIRAATPRRRSRTSPQRRVWSSSGSCSASRCSITW